MKKGQERNSKVVSRFSKNFFSVALLCLLFLARPSFAGPQGGTTGQVRVTADVIDTNYLSITSLQDMRIPQVYSSFHDTASSEDTTPYVIGGLAGQNATFSVTGRAGIAYDITFNPRGLLLDANGHQLAIRYDFSETAGGMLYNDHKGNGVRGLDGNGNDTLTIMGAVDFDGNQPVGKYNNYSSPLVVTISYDKEQSDKLGGGKGFPGDTHQIP